MKAPLSLAVCIAWMCDAALAAQPASTVTPPTASRSALPPQPEWLTDANGCKFRTPAMLSHSPPFTIQWSGTCAGGFVDGPGEVRDGPVLFRGEFSQGFMLKGTMEAGGMTIEGTFVDNEPHGDIVVHKVDGVVIRTTYDRGKIDFERVEMSWPDGSHYRGSIDRFLQMNGKGILEYANGSVYEGEFKQGRFHGAGVLKLIDGEVRSGTFVADQLEGKGSILYANQSRYEGELRAGEPHGQGRMDYTTGEYYEGAFVAGKFQGRGKLKYADGSVYEGEFLAGEASGTGTVTYPNGSSYVGQFRYNKRNGTGRLTRASGEIYDGEWKDDRLTGKCRITFEQGFYEGQCLDGKASGHGHLEDQSRHLTYDGEFLEDRFQGKGSLRLGELAYEGMFKDGVMHGPGTLSAGKVTVRGDFNGGVMTRGTVHADDGRTFEVDLEKNEILEVMQDGTKRPLDQLPPDITI